MDPDKFFDALALVPNMRSARFDDLAVTDLEEGFRFEGHAAVFDEVADLGEFTEAIDRGAFRKALASAPNVPMLVEHDPTKLLATTRSGTLRLSEDSRGLKVEADVADTQLGRDVRTLVKRGDIHGMSFGFVAGRANQKIERRNGKPHRRLTGFNKLLDVCATWDPAYRSAEAQFRSMAMKFADSPESLQQLLMGAYPQLEDRAADLDGTEEDEAPAEADEAPDGEPAAVAGEGDESGAAEQRTLSAAAARNRLLLIKLELEGGLPL